MVTVMVTAKVEDAGDMQAKIDLITKYIQEKDAFELPEWSQKGKELIQMITSSTSSTVQ
jgi:hypothetical protein